MESNRAHNLIHHWSILLSHVARCMPYCEQKAKERLLFACCNCADLAFVAFSNSAKTTAVAITIIITVPLLNVVLVVRVPLYTTPLGSAVCPICLHNPHVGSQYSNITSLRDSIIECYYCHSLLMLLKCLAIGRCVHSTHFIACWWAIEHFTMPPFICFYSIRTPS